MQRVLVLSDLHFGLPARRTPTPAMLRPLWQEVDHLLLNGDTCELHEPGMRERSIESLHALMDMCREDGVDLSIIAGNHDPFISPLQRCTLVDGRVLVTHGHDIHRTEPRRLVEGQQAESGDAASLSGRHRFDHEAMRDAIERSQRHQPPEHELQAPQTLLDSIPWSASKPFLVLKILRYWRNFPGFAQRYRAQVASDTKVILVGHSHRDGVWKSDGCTVLNTGSWTWPGRPQAVYIDGTVVRMSRIRVRGGTATISMPPDFEQDLAQD